MAKKDLRDSFELIDDLTGPDVTSPVRWFAIGGTAIGFVGGLTWALLMDVPINRQGVFVGLDTLGGLVLGVIVGSLVERLVGSRSAGKRKNPGRRDRRFPEAGSNSNP
jgi:hypothetical protein